MEKIASFTVNHIDLLTGLYVSRRDKVGGEVVTTFDMRVTRPNLEPVMDTPALHAIEHLGATFLRNHAEWKEKTVYFGPMGCRTGFYIILVGDLTPTDIYGLMTEMCGFILAYQGTIPGASARDCGNYLDLNLDMAKYYIRKYKQEVLDNFTEERRVYPE
ncbi:MAG: S-ribosylhomocysteine lyase [Clostridia bacterium]|nr:S-ribosylhomocysteine lyase [Clostridia bacterium]